jgi:hypothetical protein
MIAHGPVATALVCEQPARRRITKMENTTT